MDQFKAVASVGGEKIFQSDVDQAVITLMQRGQDMDNPEGRAMILDELITHKLFLLDARKNLYEYKPEFVKQLQQIKDEMLTNFAIAKAVEDVNVTDEEAKKFFEENKDRFVSDETVNASHILVDSEEKALEIKADIEAGNITFEDAAKQFSSCPSKSEGGDLGDFGRGQMVPEFEQAAFALDEGQISGAVKTQFGYHLIKLNSKSAPKPIEYADIADGIKENLLKEKKQQAFRSRSNQLKILFPVEKY